MEMNKYQISRGYGYAHLKMLHGCVFEKNMLLDSVWINSLDFKTSIKIVWK